MHGRLIVVEGLDGVGKTTTSRGLAVALGAVWLTTPSVELRPFREPFDSRYRGNAAASQLFYAAAVVDAARQAEVLRRAGRDVVIDRYWSTTWAYARVGGSPLDLDEVEALLPCADVTILVELPEAERQRRLLARGATAMDLDTLRTGPALRHHLRLALTRPIAGRGVVLDAAGLEPAATVDAALDLVDRLSPLALFDHG